MRTLELVGQEAAACTRCGLAEGRTQVVFGSGHPAADLMFVGEAPGFHEDRKGMPFVGAAGGLLTRLLAGIGLSREDVYIANVLKCRPPGNRDPLPEEIEACKPWLIEQLELVNPLLVCTLGNFATRLLLGRATGISRVRGQVFDYDGRVLIPTFHPAAVLHGGGALSKPMAQMQEDFRSLDAKLRELRAAREAAAAREAVAAVPAEQLGLF